MIFIAHRGNLDGPNNSKENKPDYILTALKEGYYVEIDVWYIKNKFYLGHDYPAYEIDIEFLKNKSFYCHAKNLEALDELLKISEFTNCFSHDKDNYVITSNRKIWAYSGQKLNNNTICCMPENTNQTPTACYGVCTDYPIKYKHINLLN